MKCLFGEEPEKGTFIPHTNPCFYQKQNVNFLSHKNQFNIKEDLSLSQNSSSNIQYKEYSVLR